LSKKKIDDRKMHPQSLSPEANFIVPFLIIEIGKMAMATQFWLQYLNSHYLGEDPFRALIRAPSVTCGWYSILFAIPKSHEHAFYNLDACSTVKSEVESVALTII
jgi:hypothetical protein